MTFYNGLLYNLKAIAGDQAPANENIGYQGRLAKSEVQLGISNKCAARVLRLPLIPRCPSSRTVPRPIAHRVAYAELD